MNKSEQIVLQNVRKLDELEKKFLKFTYETKKPQTSEEFKSFVEESIQMAGDAFNTKNDILEYFININELNIYDKNVLNSLDSIRNGKKFSSISFYEDCMRMFNNGKENSVDKVSTFFKEVLANKFDDLFSDFHTWFDVVGYYFDKITIGPIISSSKVPNHILSYFEELKETYAFRQYRSSIALCRALLEMALLHKLTAKGAFKTVNTKVTKIDVAKEDNLNRYINMAKWNKILSENNHEKAHEIRRIANDILHAKKEINGFNNKPVLDTIITTINIIEELYR